jgi:prepilin-type processing-associated H-X9-DG protein
MPRPRHSSPAAFTLLELCVVMAVTAVLSVLILLAVRHGRDAGQRAQCVSRLRNVARAVLLYTQDHDQTLPASESPIFGEPHGIWHGYREVVAPYLGLRAGSRETVEMFNCPAHKEAVPDWPSYIFSAGNQFNEDFPGVAGARLTSIVEPGRTILVAEASAFFPVSWHAPHPQTGLYSNAQNTAGFADGHVAYLPFYWDGSHLAVATNPPQDYGYKWSSE